MFPLSNWTELDVWRYIEAEELELPSIYFAHRRRVLERDGILLAESEWIRPRDGEQVEETMRPLPDRRRPDGHRGGALGGRRHRVGDRARPRPRRSPSAARPEPTTASPRRRWRTASARAISDGRDRADGAARTAAAGHRRLGRRRQEHADRAAAARHRLAARRPPRRRLARGAELDLAAITDGLRAEREQGITIDVAYRFFSTDRRSFILADTPGHERYTRNMFTGASTADVARRADRCPRRRRHPDPPTRAHRGAAGDPAHRVCVNKMDLVELGPGAVRGDRAIRSTMSSGGSAYRI